MAQLAPAHPSIQTLESMFPLSPGTELMIAEKRHRVSDILRGKIGGIVGTQGPCAMTGDIEIIYHEGDRLQEAENITSGLVTLHRLPPWKPRSNPKSSHGHETDPKTTVEAYQIIAERADATANLAIEIGHLSHIARYASRISFGWIGGRNVQETGLITALALAQPDLPMGIKNGLDGDITLAMQQVELVNRIRGENAAPAVLIYRGGANATTPDAWEKAYLDAHDRTNGMLIVDSAHGGEMAHDPNKGFNKTVIGQVACLNHIIRVGVEQDKLPIGVIIEASQAISPVDPVMDFEQALDKIVALNALASNANQAILTR